MMRIAVVGPVAQRIPPARSGSVESVTALLTEGLVARGHDVTLFATGSSTTSARLHATFLRGYHEDLDLWPWELCELMNLAAAVERAADFDVIHYQAEYAPLSLAFARLTETPVLVTVHHAPTPAEVALWSRAPGAAFVAISDAQRTLLGGLNVAGTIHHAVDTHALRPQGEPEDYLLFLGRFTEGKGVLEAINVAQRTGHRLVLAAAESDWYREVVAPRVDGERVVYAGEVGGSAKAALLARAGALLYPVQASEPFGLVMAEAMACGTPVAALRRGAVGELVDDGVTGFAFDSLDALVEGLPRVLALDRACVRSRALERFGPDRMVDEHLEVYAGLARRRHDLGGSSLLAVVAHPDDESLACGGLLALCADAGARISLLCLTHGESGPGDGAARGGGAARDSLGGARARELGEAARVLGIGDVVLREHEDGMLPWSDAAVLEADVLDAIHRLRPDVVITFDRDGLYWHPDHVAVHERVTAAVARMGAAAPALYYASMQPGAMRSLVEAAPRGDAHVLGVTAVDAFGSMAPEPSLVVDAGSLATRKLAALRCHRTQVEGSVLDFLDERDAARLLGTEHYRRAEVGARGEAFVERFGKRIAAAGS